MIIFLPVECPEELMRDESAEIADERTSIHHHLKCVEEYVPSGEHENEPM